MGVLDGLLGGLISAGGSVATSIINAQSVDATNRANEALMRESWMRDDNAVQRRKADLVAAGLNPVLAAGSAADSGSPIRLEAPKMDGNVGNAALQGAQQQINIAQTEASTRLTQAQADRVQTESDLLKTELPYAAKMAELAWKIRTSDQYKASQSEISAGLQADYDYWERAHMQEFADLRLKSAQLGWSQQKLDQQEVQLRNQLLKKDIDTYEARAVTGVLGSAVGSAAGTLKGAQILKSLLGK